MLFDFPATHYMLFTITLLTPGSGTADILRTAPEESAAPRPISAAARPHRRPVKDPRQEHRRQAREE